MPICGATSPIGDICQREPGHRGDHESFGPDVSSRWTNPVTAPTPEPTPESDGEALVQNAVAYLHHQGMGLPAAVTLAQGWLAAHDARVRAEAWDEGADFKARHPHMGAAYIRSANPHRKEAPRA